MNNSNNNDKPSVSLQAYIRSGGVQARIQELLQKRAGEFTVSLMSVVNSNPVLQECPPDTVVKAALTAAGMNLPINPNLGFAYIIPYWNSKAKQYEAQFQMGYKGFIQLAQRSGQFKRINSSDVREGEYLGVDRRSGEVEVEFEKDDAKRAKLKVVGYLGYFRLLNGFEKESYMTVAELQKHGKRYSQSFKKGYGLWVDDFDSMAKKTVLKLLISKYGALNTVMQEAILADQAVVDEDDDYDYVDNKKTPLTDARKKDEDTPEAETESTEGNDNGGTPEQKEAEAKSVKLKESKGEATPKKPIEPEKTSKEKLNEKIEASRKRRAAEAEAKAKEGKLL